MYEYAPRLDRDFITITINDSVLKSNHIRKIDEPNERNLKKNRYIKQIYFSLRLIFNII